MLIHCFVSFYMLWWEIYLGGIVAPLCISGNGWI